MASASDFPRPPSFYSIRPARLEDVDRMAFVGIAGFRHSEIFEFERPYYEKYPQDTFQSFQKIWRDLICDPNTVTLVAEDDYNEQEDSYEPSVQSHMFPGLKNPHGKVIVGASSWTYEAGSKRHAQNSSFGSGLFRFFSRNTSSPRRDEIVDRTRRVNEVESAANEKYFKGCNLLAKIVIHPAYWRRGHGTVLLSWGKRLADMDGVNQGTLPSRMGAKIAFVQGFDHIDDVHVDGDEEGPRGIDLAVGLYKSKKRATASDRVPSLQGDKD